MSQAQPFAGIRVIEFGQFVAVPFCGQLLAEGGAYVIKVESMAGDPNRHMGEISSKDSLIFISRNRGKHSLPLNLNNPKAKAVINALVASADVVLMNFRPGLAEEIGLGPNDLLAKHPKLIVGEITPFGKNGPDAMLAGMDIVVQARSGLMAAMGRIVDDRPAPGEPVISDYMAATSLAFGVSSALLRRERTGQGGIVDVSLMQAAMTLANNQLTRHEDLDKPAHDKALLRLKQQRQDGAPYEEQLASMPSNRTSAIRNVYFRTYETADGTIALACASKGLQDRFNSALGIVPPSGSLLAASAEVIEALRVEVEALIRSQISSHWIGVLTAAGVPVSTVKFPVELFEDEQASANTMFKLVTHESGQIRVLAPPVRMDSEGFSTQPPAEPFSSETESLLSDLGLSKDDIHALIENKITRNTL
ncbi:MAG: CoA transferase [Pseudomonadales bacterium]|nr:CoA transferase [Pseudomonadales bacterium]